MRWANKCVKYWNLTMNCSRNMITYTKTKFNDFYIYISNGYYNYVQKIWEEENS